MLATWIGIGLDLYTMVEKNELGVPKSRKQLLIMLVDRLNGMGALTFDALNSQTGECATSLIGTGLTGATVLGTATSGVGFL